MKSTPPTQTLNHRVLVTPDQTHNLLVTDEPPSRYYIAPQLRQRPPSTTPPPSSNTSPPPSPPPKNCSTNALPTPPLPSLPAYLEEKKTWGSGTLTTADQPRRLPEPPT
ncbi:hypothetical protein Scep_003065 [Stephania cephalantha]|uniref:Uncharacterized protein n=1 Tax=Stephania cephalantha TaxID=152367 RepID=A0AAP0PXP7_9MAGN